MVKTKSHILVVTAAVIVLSLLYFYFDPRYSAIFPPCPFYAITGFYCPGCGSQRAFHALLSGKILQSAGYNLLFLLSLPLIGIAAFLTIRNVFYRRNDRFFLFHSTFFSRAVLMGVLIFWVLRNIPYYPLTLLAP